MGNSWGYDSSQHYPPLMSAWAKNHLGWLDVEALEQSGTYHLPALHSSPKVYAVINSNNPFEFFLLENKQRFDFFDKKLPSEGIIIYHCDEEAGYNEEGYPGQPGWYVSFSFCLGCALTVLEIMSSQI